MSRVVGKGHQRTIVAVSLVLAFAAALLLFERRASDLPGQSEASSGTLLFDGESALRYAEAQCALGPRPTGSSAGRRTGEYLLAALKSSGWQVESQEFAYRGVGIRNLIAKKGTGTPIIVGAHYDTRPRADFDQKDPESPIIGGNDGASGVAVLLELARVLPRQAQRAVWLAFFDAEDRGGLEGWPFSVGADAMARSLTEKPEAVVVLDMIGDRDLQIYYEANSTMSIQAAIFAEAAKLGYTAQFIPQVKHAMTDDHTPFLALGYPAVDLIDFDYPHWHTLQDTCDKISSSSLEQVGRTMQAWLNSQGVVR